MTHDQALQRMAQLTADAAKAVADFATFMARDYPELASKLAHGRALEPPMRAALAALEAFTAEWPHLPVPAMPDGPTKAAALSLITPTTKH